MFEQLLVQFGDVEQFLQEAVAAKLAQQIVPQIRETLSDQESPMNLQLQLAAIVDVGHHFVTATYYLEGDGPLVFSCYAKLQAVAEACRVPHFPNVRAVSTAIVTEDPTQNVDTLEQRARECVDPAIQWFLRKFNVQLYDLVAAFKAARIMCPVAVQWMRPTAATVSALRILPFLNSDRIIDGLIAELPDYVVDAQVVTTEEEKVKWWCQHVERLPCWSAAVKQVLLVQPSSAAAERAFSLLSAAFSDQQDRALADYLQASVMLQYNKR